MSAITLTPVEQAVVAYARRHPGMTFVEMERVLKEHGIDTDGEQAIGAANQPHMVFWLGMSAAFVEIVVHLQQARVLEMDATSWIAYVHEGRVPNMAILTDVPRSPLTQGHWVPVCFYAREMDA